VLDWLAGNSWWEWILIPVLVGVVGVSTHRFILSAGGARTAFDWCVVAFVVGVVGFLASMVMDYASLTDEAYGDVTVPGSARLHLPAGDVLVTLHTEAIAEHEDAVIPDNLELLFTPPSGVGQPSVTDLLGDDADEPPPRRQPGYWSSDEASRDAMVAHISQAGDYTITTKGTDSLSVSPRLSFGRRSVFEFLMWPFFPGLTAVSLVAGLVAFALRRDEPEGGPVVVDPDLLASGQRVRGVLKSFTRVEAKASARRRRKAPSETDLPDAPYYALEVELSMPTLVRVSGRNRQQVPLTEVSKLAIGRELSCLVDPSAPSTRFIVDWNHRLH